MKSKKPTFWIELDGFHFTAPFRVRGDSVAGGIVSPFERTDRIDFTKYKSTKTVPNGKQVHGTRETMRQWSQFITAVTNYSTKSVDRALLSTL